MRGSGQGLKTARAVCHQGPEEVLFDYGEDAVCGLAQRTSESGSEHFSPEHSYRTSATSQDLKGQGGAPAEAADEWQLGGGSARFAGYYDVHFLDDYYDKWWHWQEMEDSNRGGKCGSGLDRFSS
jgi:hypothetical protein